MQRRQAFGLFARCHTAVPGTNRLVVWEREGRVWTFANTATVTEKKLVLDLHSQCQGWDDSGRERWEVPESLIIGKAFWVYWPHAKPVWPMIRIGADFRFPARPYFERVRWIL